MRSKLSKDPFIRSLRMRVYPVSRRSMMVVGGSTPHEVFAFANKLKCDCTAAQYGRFCAHIAAIQHLTQEYERKGTMPTFELDTSSAGDRKPVVGLPRKGKMAYAGLLSSWWIQNNEYGVSVGIKALVTHIASGKGWEKLDAITEATTYVNPKWFYNAQKNEASYLMQLINALTGQSYTILQKLTTDDVKKILNDNVGTGLQFAASIEKKKKDGSPFNAVDKESFEEADAAFSPLAQAMQAKIETKVNKDGNTYIAKPQPAFQAEEQRTSLNNGATFDDNNTLDDEVPF